MLENSVYVVEKLDGSTTWPGHLIADDNEKRFWTFYKSKVKKKKWRKGSDVYEWTGEISQRLKASMKTIKTATNACLWLAMKKSVSFLLLNNPFISEKSQGRVSHRIEKSLWLMWSSANILCSSISRGILKNCLHPDTIRKKTSFLL